MALFLALLSLNAPKVIPRKLDQLFNTCWLISTSIDLIVLANCSRTRNNNSNSKKPLISELLILSFNFII